MTHERPILGGTDGFRGEATDEPGSGKMNPETVAWLSYALVRHQQEQGLDGPVVIARDTRPSGEKLSQAAALGVIQADAKIIYDGILPTPAAQKHAERVGAMATIVITASHNPVEDNGWKGMLGSRKPSSDEVRAISDRYWGLERPRHSWMTGNHRLLVRGVAGRETREHYVNMVVDDIESQFGWQPLEGKLFVIDAANGAASHITPEVFRRLGAEIRTIATGEGVINDGHGAADLSGLRKYLQRRPDITSDPAFIGALANDGDADRVMAMGVTERGEIVEITGNHIMEAMATNPNQPGIVGTIYTNSGLRQRLSERNISFEECDNGDVHVTRTLEAKQLTNPAWQRGGEFTGHIIDTSWLGSGDGVRTAAWFASLASTTGRTFGDIYQEQPMWPEVMNKIKLPQGVEININESSLIQDSLALVRELGARPIVRASGTEPVVRVWTEAPDMATVNNANVLLYRSVIGLTERA